MGWLVAANLNRMLEKYRIFNSLYHLLELKKRDDLVQLILENLDYTS